MFYCYTFYQKSYIEEFKFVYYTKIAEAIKYSLNAATEYSGC